MPCPFSPPSSCIRGGSQQQFYEETQTDAFGRFRLRGLNPGTTYDVRVKSSGRFARASPAVHSVAMTAADVEGLSFMAFRQPSTVDITGVVTVDNPVWQAGLRARE